MVLLLRRTHPPGFWQSVTGSMGWDEGDPLLTARRELLEETGIDGAAIVDCGVENRFAIRPPWRSRYPEGVGENRERVYRLPLPEPVPVTLSPLEHDAYRWLPRGKALCLAASTTNRAAIQRFVPKIAPDP
ncbi:MAG: dihydroneopterin triphosphate diphosphatase [Candidatus Competibacterales bacterium]